MLLLYFAFCKDCNTNYSYPNHINRIDDYRECSRKLDSVFLERRKKKEMSDNWTIDSSAANTKITRRDSYYIDSIKVSYPGKDGMQIVKIYPLHKTIVD
jgi:hypothetical protein